MITRETLIWRLSIIFYIFYFSSFFVFLAYFLAVSLLQAVCHQRLLSPKSGIEIGRNFLQFWVDVPQFLTQVLPFILSFSPSREKVLL